MASDNKHKKKKASLTAVKYAFRNIIWPRKWLLLAGLVLIIINRLAGLVLPGSTKVLIDQVIPGRDLNDLYLLLSVVFGAILLQGLTSFFLTQILSIEAQRLIADLRLKVQEQVLYMPVRFFDNNRSGALVSRIMSDVEGVRNLVGTGLVQLFGGVLTSVIAFVLLMNINAEMTMYSLLPMVVFGLIALKAFAYIRPIFRQRSVINAEVTGRLTETLGGIRVIKGFNAEEQEVRIFRNGVDRIFHNVRQSLLSTSLVTSSATLLLGIASILIMGFGGRLMMQETMTTGDFFAFTLYLGFLVAPIVQMSNIGSQITEAFAGLDRMDELLSQQRENDSLERTIELKDVKGDIVFEKVGFEYEAGKAVIHDISFVAKAGSITALVGTSGSGKSTIAGLAASFLIPDKGCVELDGIDLKKVKLESYRKHLGVVLQDDFLFEGTIRENIIFPRPDASDEEIRAAIVAAHVDEFTDRFQSGIETLIGERGVKLSGGQRQRIAIARALLADPKVLILDEATSNLDAESESYIQASLQQLMKGRTTFVIAHRLSTIRQADQILVIENGKIVELGDHGSLLEQRGRYYQLFTYQSRI